MSLSFLDLIQRIKKDIKPNNTKTKTKLEQLIELFEQKDIIILDEMLPIYNGAKRPDHQVRRGIVDLNEHLGKEGYKIEHVTAFRLVRKK